MSTPRVTISWKRGNRWRQTPLTEITGLIPSDVTGLELIHDIHEAERVLLELVKQAIYHIQDETGEKEWAPIVNE